jgi:subtilisin family serine protease
MSESFQASNDVLGATYRPDQILLQFDPDADEATRSHALEAIGGQLNAIIASGSDDESVDPLDATDLNRIQLGHGMTVEKAMEILSHLPGVKFAEPDYAVSPGWVSNDTGVTGGKTWGLYGDVGTPTNAYGSQATEAWAAGFTGSTKVAIGVVDTGVDYTHPDLYLNIWLNQGEIPTALRGVLTDTNGDGLITFVDLNASANAAYVTDKNANGRIDAGDLLNDTRWENGTDEDANGYKDDLIGWDFQNNDNDPMDATGHGTNIAGTIGATGGNGTGISGVAPGTQIVALKFMDSTGGYTSDAIRALDYFTNASKHSAGVDFAATSNSWGSGSASTGLLDAINRGAAQNILFVSAAMNGGSDGVGDNNDNTANYPSNYSTTAVSGYDAVIAVASINSSGALSSFSNYGPKTVDLAAPGEVIYSTALGGGYNAWSGTSMATPFVAGAIALYSAAHPTATAAEIRAAVLGSTDATASLTGKTVTGGRLDVGKLMGSTVAPPPAPPPSTTTGVTVIGTSVGDLITPLVTVTGQLLPGGGADVLQGMDGNDTLDGGAGADTLTGGVGNDVFTVDSTGDVIVEAVGGGNDLVQSQITYTLGANLERLTLTGTAAINGTGNELANTLTGNSAANLLTGLAGNDTLNGGSGNDTLVGGDGADRLDGGSGADRMDGGVGDDLYYVNNTGDVVVESLSGSTGGVDKVYSWITYTLPTNVENLTLSGSGTTSGAGNSLGNTLSGNGAANHLYGLAGTDILSGGDGADTLDGGAGADTLTGGTGADYFVFQKGEAQGDRIQDFAVGDHIELHGYASGSTIVQVSGSTTAWIITDAATHATETITLANGYKLLAGDFLFT